MPRLLSIFVFLSALAYSQSTGSIVGTVVDPSGLGMASVAIKLTNIATTAVREATTNERGDFVFSSLPPGEYNVSAAVQDLRLTKSDRSACPPARPCRSELFPSRSGSSRNRCR